MSAPPSLTTRLASLADSVFGVAMTLLAYDITVPDTGDTRDVVRSLAPKVYALALSFSVAAMYWLNQQRRLSHYHRMNTEVHGVLGEFVLLFAVIMLPITTRSFVQGHTVLLYGGNLTVIAWLNFGLAYRALRSATPAGQKLPWLMLTLPGTNAAFFLFALVESVLLPGTSHNLWFLAFTLPLLARFFPTLRGTTHDQT